MAKNFTGRSIDNILLSEIDAPIGAYRDSDLSPSLFLEESVGQWLLCNGQSCVGTAYAQKTGKSTVPDFVTSGAFRRQVKTGRNTGTLEAEAFKSHTHIQDPHTHIQNAHNHTVSSSTADTSVGGGKLPYGSAGGAAWGTSSATAINQNATATNQNTGGEETRPVNIGVNVYIKVGY